MTKFINFLLALITIALFLTIGISLSSRSDAEDTLIVYTQNEAIGDIAKSIGGSNIAVRNVSNGINNFYNFEYSDDLIREIVANGDLYFNSTIGESKEYSKLREDIFGYIDSYDISVGIKPLALDDNTFNPYIWNSYANQISIAKNIHSIFIKLLPDKVNELNNNFDMFYSSTLEKATTLSENLNFTSKEIYSGSHAFDYILNESDVNIIYIDDIEDIDKYATEETTLSIITTKNIGETDNEYLKIYKVSDGTSLSDEDINNNLTFISLFDIIVNEFTNITR